MQGNHIRNAVRAIIIEDSKILLCKYEDKEGIFYACVGGGQNTFEDMHSALRRECKEEINSEIIIEKMVCVREAFFDNYDKGGIVERIHQIEYFFKCSLKDMKNICIGNNPDFNSLGFEWIPLEKLKDLRIFPSLFKEYIHPDGTFKDIVYLGLSN
ncbi:NUDIX domain-containing protein [Clostridium sp. YIM B02551]|uniref:NUDIX domain-containing protein n=1 Tax=Clostridium sp. YIM B02551 TaxID=2910679 RepID=UPI001EEC0ED2|nr:NUDIX domain-containing protein [Clostridium sp. YIM B02551]